MKKELERKVSIMTAGVPKDYQTRAVYSARTHTSGHHGPVMRDDLPPPPYVTSRNPECYGCKKMGHRIADCPEQRKTYY